jgi:hypothetical protein
MRQQDQLAIWVGAKKIARRNKPLQKMVFTTATPHLSLSEAMHALAICVILAFRVDKPDPTDPRKSGI